MELLLNVMDLTPRGFALLAIQLRGRCTRQPAVRAAHNRRHHFQIA